MGKRGPQPQTITDDQRQDVMLLAATGNTFETIGRIMKMSQPTLRKHFAFELENGKEMANHQVAKSLYRKATEDGSERAQTFWLQMQAKWKAEPEEIDLRVTDETSDEARARAMALLLARKADG